MTFFISNVFIPLQLHSDGSETSQLCAQAGFKLSYITYYILSL